MTHFTAQIKEIKVSLDAVGDKVGRIVLTFWPDDNVMISELSALQTADTNVIVEISEET